MKQYIVTFELWTPQNVLQHENEKIRFTNYHSATIACENYRKEESDGWRHGANLIAVDAIECDDCPKCGAEMQENFCTYCTYCKS